jgi:hypothetical protein
LRDRKPQQNESDEDKKGLKHEVHLRIRKMMEAKHPMDPDNIEGQNETVARGYAPKEWSRGRSVAPKLKPNECRDGAGKHCELCARRSDRIQRDRKREIWLRAVYLTKSGGGGQTEVRGRGPPFVYLCSQSGTGC